MAGYVSDGNSFATLSPEAKARFAERFRLAREQAGAAGGGAPGGYAPAGYAQDGGYAPGGYAQDGGYAPGGYASRYSARPAGGSGAYGWNEADRNWAYDTGTGLMNEYGQQAGREGERFDQAEQGAAGQAESDINDELGGVNRGSVRRLEQFDNQLEFLRPDANDFDAINLSGDEKNGLMGQPDAGREYYQPDQLRSVQNETAWDRREAAKQLGSSMTDVANSTSDALGRAAGSYAKRLDAAVDPNKLRLDQGFADRYRLNADTQAAMNEAAGRDVGLTYSARENEMARKAAAAGVNPAAAVATSARLNRDSAVGRADAMLKARLATNEAAAGRERDIESMRLGAEGAAADAGMRRADAQANYEMQAADRSGQYRMDAARTGGQARLGVEGDVAGERQGLERYAQETGYRQARAADDTRTGRYAGVVDREIDAGKTWYGMRSDAQKAISGFREGREGRIFDAGQQNAQQARAYKYGRPGMYSGRQMQYEQNRQQTYGDTGRLGQAATQARMDDETRRWQTEKQIKAQKGGFWGKLVGGALGAAANIVPGGGIASKLITGFKGGF